MVLTYSTLAILVVSMKTLVSDSKAVNGTAPTIKSMLDPKRRSELIDEAFLEQKDILLDMLETKLKEVRDKKKKPDRADNINDSESKCEFMPRNVDVILKAHGISAIGDTDVRLKYGEDGNGSLSLDATGISNIGKAHVILGVGDGNVHIPGLDNIFTGNMVLKKACNNNTKTEVDNNHITVSELKPDHIDLNDIQTRRIDRNGENLDVGLQLNETTNFVDKAENNDVYNNNTDYTSNSTSILRDTTIVSEATNNEAEAVIDTNISTAV